MMKCFLDFKVEVVTASLHGSDGYMRVALRHVVPTTLFRHWVAADKPRGAVGLTKPL